MNYFSRFHVMSGIEATLAGGVLAMACGMELASPAAAAPGDKAAVVRTLATRVGLIVGAASNCRNLARPRVQAVVDKFSIVIRESSANEFESAEITQQLDRSLGDGRRAMTNVETDCPAAERQFADLERSIVTSALTDAPAVPAFAPIQSAPIQSTNPFPPVQSAAVQTIAAPPGGGTAVRGVTDREIRFGIAAAFTGSSKELGRQMKLGIDMAFSLANDSGGINGRMVRLIAADDGYDPKRTIEAMTQLYDKEQVMGFVGNVGTGTSEVGIRFALDRRALFFGAFTGASFLRRDPPDRYVFNYRPSYAEETDAAVRYLVKVRRLQPRQIAVFTQQDGYGDAGFAGVVKAMRGLGAGDQVALRMFHQRGSIDVTDAVNQLKAYKGTPIRAVVMTAAYRASAKFIERTRDLYPAMIYTAVSIGSTELADELKLLGPRYAAGLITTQVVPAVDSYSSAILEYKAALAKYFQGETPNYVSLEGYVSGSILVQALKQAGPQLDTERLVESLENLRKLDLGLGALQSFGRTEHQASHKVWGTQLDEAGKYQAIDLD